MLGTGRIEVPLPGPCDASFPRGRVIDAVDQHVDGRTDLARQLLGRNARRERHHALEALLLDVLGHLLGHGRRGGPLDRLELERADAVELRFLEPVSR